MPRQWKLHCVLSWTLVLLSMTMASAESLGRTEIFLGSAGEGRKISLLSGDGAAARGSSATLDYATFAFELLAFVTKEVLSDSADEYPESPIGSRLTRSMPERRSEFGRHCLTVVTRLGAAVPYLSEANAEIGAALALRTVSSTFAKDTGNDRGRFSLNPKVGADKAGFSLTFHW